jgi:hypothetical protein
MTDLDDLISAARSAALQPHATDVEVGRLAGLLDIDRAALSAGTGESTLHHAGYLVGHLIRWLHERGRPLEQRMMLTAAAYGASIADEGGQRMLAKPDRPMSAHTYAAIRTEQKTGSALTETDERMLFGWLSEQAGIEPTPQLVVTLERRRALRLARTGLSSGGTP